MPRRPVGEGAPTPVPDLWLSLPHEPDRPLQWRALAVAAREYAVSEAVALDVFRHIQQLDLGPEARPVVDRIVVDEARHAAFGWAALDELLGLTGDEGRALLAERSGGRLAAGEGPTHVEAPGLPPGVPAPIPVVSIPHITEMPPAALATSSSVST